MRILLVSDFLPPVAGGLEFHVVALAGGLIGRGHEVAIATQTLSATPIPGVVIFGIHTFAGNLLPHADPSRPFHPPFPDPVARRSLAKVVESWRPDVVHAHSWLAVSLPAVSKPLVLTAHDYGLACPIHTLMRPSGRNCLGPQGSPCMRCTASTISAPAALLVPSLSLGRSLLRPNRVIAVSSSVAAGITSFVPSEALTVIPNFSDQTPYGPRPDSLPDSPYVMYGGDPGDHKGVPDLLAAWDMGPSSLASLVVATTKPTAIASSGVTVINLRRDQMSSAWSHAELAVVPSRWADPCPTVAIEAMAAGTPVVGSNIGGLPDLVRDGIDGLLVAPNSPPALARAIVRLLRDSEMRARMSRACTERAVTFSADSVIPQILNIYEEVVAEHRRGRRLRIRPLNPSESTPSATRRGWIAQ